MEQVEVKIVLTTDRRVGDKMRKPEHCMMVGRLSEGCTVADLNKAVQLNMVRVVPKDGIPAQPSNGSGATGRK